MTASPSGAARETSAEARRRAHGSAVYTVAGVLYRLVSMVTGVILRRLIAPSQFGLWNLVQVVVDFVAKFDLGSGATLVRDVPIERGRAAWSAVDGLQSSAFVLVAAQGLVSAVGVLVYGWLSSPSGTDPMASIVWFGAAAMVLVGPVSVAGQSLSQAHSRFAHAGYMSLGVGVISSLTVLTGGVTAGATGLVVGGATGAVLGALGTWLYLSRLGIRIHFRSVSLGYVRRVLSFGLPLRVLDYPSTIFFAADGYVVAMLHDRAQLAIYFTGRLFSAVGYEMSTRLTAAERNEWKVRTGKEGSDRAISEGALQLVHFQTWVVIPAVALATFAGGQVLTYALMPEYVGAVGVLRVLILSWFFLPQAYGIRDLWVVRGNFRALFTTGLFGLGTFAALIVASRGLGLYHGLESLALLFAISSAVYMAVVLAWTGRQMWGPGTAVRVGVSLVVSATAVWFLSGFIELSGTGVPTLSDILRLSGRGGLGVLPWLLYGWLLHRGRRASQRLA